MISDMLCSHSDKSENKTKSLQQTVLKRLGLFEISPSTVI